MRSKTVESIAASKIIHCTVSTIQKSMSGGRYTAYFDESLNDAEITDKRIERLDEGKYSLLIKTSIAGEGCLTDLQFPLYEQNNMEPKEREFAKLRFFFPIRLNMNIKFRRTALLIISIKNIGI